MIDFVAVIFLCVFVLTEIVLCRSNVFIKRLVIHVQIKTRVNKTIKATK